MEAGHIPVLAEEVMSMLAPAPGSLQIDATLGGGGHTERILEATDPDGRLLGLDADGAAVARVAGRLRPRFGDRLVLRQANFRELATVAPAAGFAAVDGASSTSASRATSSPTRERGFGFRAGGPLDMRFDATRGVPAAELLATLDADELTALFRRYGEEPNAGRIARAIVDARQTAPIATAEELAALIERVVPQNPRKRDAGPTPPPGSSRRCASRSTRSSMRSRPPWPPSMDLLRPGGRLVVLSYHSLEDRIVKRFIAAERRGCICPPEVPICVCGRNPRLRPLGKSLTARPEEVAANPRSRSARLRVAERIAA